MFPHIFGLGFAVLVGLIIAVVFSFLLPPSNFPKNIPTIPFYYSLLPLFKLCDQETLYHEYLEEPLRKHGAVKIFFASRWNILVQRPEFLQEIFKNEDIYAKSGNQRKIPYSVIAHYTGDNIISAHGADWRLYRSVVAPGLQREFDPKPLVRNAHTLADLFIMEQKKTGPKGVLVLPILQRFSLENVAESLLGTKFGTLESVQAPMHQMQVIVKRKIFHPLFLGFPLLDRFPIPSRVRARKLVDDFVDQLCNKVLDSHQHPDSECPSRASAGCRLAQAYRSGLLTEKQFRHNATIVMVAGHENPQLLLQTLLLLLGEHQDVQARVRNESLSAAAAAASTDPAAAPLLPYLTAAIFEALRLYPPISQLINRRTTAPALLGNAIALPANVYIGYNGYGTGHDKAFWGPDADDFRPERWGGTVEEVNQRARDATRRGGFIAFHGGRRACLGQRFAVLEVRETVAVLVRRCRWSIAEGWRRGMTPAGPLSPMMLRVVFEEMELDQ